MICLAAVHDLSIAHRLHVSETKIKRIHEISKNILENITTGLNQSYLQENPVAHIRFPCQEKPLVYHHAYAGDVLVRENKLQLKYVCESMLLIDKVKETNLMFDLWNGATENNYYNFSAIWLKDRDEGWVDLLHEYDGYGIDRNSNRRLVDQECLQSMLQGDKTRLCQREVQRRNIISQSIRWTRRGWQIHDDLMLSRSS